MALKSKPLKRDWTEAREKVEREGVCRYCGDPGLLFWACLAALFGWRVTGVVMVGLGAALLGAGLAREAMEGCR